MRSWKHPGKPALASIKARYYKQYNANYELEIPAEGFDGWQEREIEIDLSRLALISMHAWDYGARMDFPGWYNHVEYIPRARDILEKVFPCLLENARASPVHVFHVASGGKYYKKFKGYKHARKLVRKMSLNHKAVIPKIRKTKERRAIDAFRQDECGYGIENREDIEKAFNHLNFPTQAMPISGEGVAENAQQLHALCLESGVDHLVYIGFALNWCLLLSPAGMVEMSKLGYLCSTIPEATTAVENASTASSELNKQAALWRVALSFGFIFPLKSFISSLSSFHESEA
ncbi:hypothetical protein GF325_08665 [Candidatus Bathyarchaeota archaeon]|nr:hypothetical protein [Candidatus Bathyarchaeota archaeon]